MTHTQQTETGTVAALQNVGAFIGLVERLKARDIGLAGLGVFYGFSGYGKSTAATYGVNYFNAIYVQMKSCWTSKKLCEAILIECGCSPARTVADMVDQIASEIAGARTPLIIDEADYLVTKKTIELVRDIYESTNAPIILIGEERLPQKLQRWERIHGRILDWVQAEPASIDDVAPLAKIYAPNIRLERGFEEGLLKASGGSIRRLCNNLARFREYAAVKNLNHLGAGDVDKADFMPIHAPAPRRVA